MLAYRLRYFTGILTYLLYVAINYFIWTAVFAATVSAQGVEGTINGFTASQMVTYVTVAWIARSMCFSNIDYEIDDIVRSGQISVYLMRPVSFQLLMIAQAFGELLFRVVFFTLPITIVMIFVFPIMPPAGLLNGVLFVVTTLLGFLVMAQINFLVGLAAFYLQSITSLSQMKHYMLQLLSGLLLPLSFFPHWAESILQVLPFQLITFVPLQFYLGKVPTAQIPAVLLQCGFWVAALYALSRMIWERATARVFIQGG